MSRIDGRKNDELRPVEIIPNINKFAEGSCLIRCGNTHVLCTASVEDRPPRHVPEGEGWVTAEYSMLPRANRERSRRDISKLKLNGRSAEIQRLIGRALRITGGFVAMMLAFRKMIEAGQLAEYPVSGYVAAVSAGIVDDVPLLDLCYEEDSSAMVDMNCVMDDQGRLIEIQGTGEERPFTLDEQRQLVELCEKGILRLQALQKEILGL